MMLLIPDFIFILKMCFFYPWKSQKFHENSWISGEVDRHLDEAMSGFEIMYTRTAQYNRML